MKLKSAFCIGVALALLAGPPSLAELSREQTFSGENRLTAERYVNETGAPAKGPEGYSEKKLSYSGDGAEITETFYDAGGVRVADSRGRWAVVTRLDSLGRVIKLQYLNAQGRPAPDGLTGVCGELWEYDAAGFLARRTMLDAQNAPVACREGWVYVTYENDPAGNPVKERYYGAKDRLVLLPSGSAGTDRQFDEEGRVARETFVDTWEQPAANSAGLVTIAYEYDEKDRVRLRRYYNAAGRAARDPATGAYGEAYAWSDAEGAWRVTLLDAADAVMTGSDGWAMADYAKDSAGRIVSERYYAPSGALCRAKAGYAGIERRYDADSHVTLEMYIDESGAVGPNAAGVSSVLREYDKASVAVYEAFLSPGGDTECVDSLGYAMLTRELDAEGRVLRESYFDAAGQACAPKGMGYAAVVREYDERGNVLTEAYYGASGKPVAVDGAAALVMRYDGDGNLLRRWRYGADGSPAADADGVCGTRWDYDADGTIVSMTRLGADGEPLAVDGCATVVYAYDEAGRVCSECCYDADGRPALAGGAFQVIYAYDADGRVAAKRCLDAEGRAALSDEGWASVRYERDANGDVVTTIYYGLDGELRAPEDGCACLVTERDAAGNVVRECRYNADGSLVLPAEEPTGADGEGAQGSNQPDRS